MYGDELLRAEQLHLIRLAIWAGASLLVSALLLGLLRWRASSSSLLRQFAIQMAGWGGLELAIAGAAWGRLTMPDLAAATRLDRILWLNIGLDAGYAGVGISLALCGWLLGRRLGLVGAGLAVIVHGAALLLLDARLATFISR
ncbi:MAG TPA: hypothetical protein VG818_10110 [Gemmatimonadaceae bacterium]|jgi:hypothetical protein|nr:hypothetical protein [Gemmatimonadaceae bacterium]